MPEVSRSERSLRLFKCPGNGRLNIISNQWDLIGHAEIAPFPAAGGLKAHGVGFRKRIDAGAAEARVKHQGLAYPMHCESPCDRSGPRAGTINPLGHKPCRRISIGVEPIGPAQFVIQRSIRS